MADDTPLLAWQRAQTTPERWDALHPSGAQLTVMFFELTDPWAWRIVGAEKEWHAHGTCATRRLAAAAAETAMLARKSNA